MGRLVGLELCNFKSYKGKTQVGFGTAAFTSIIGPNGSGKSNMMDAISFVLGVRSNQLRSRNIKSLIYRGRINDEDDIEGGNDMDSNDENDIDSDNEIDNDSQNDDNQAYVIAIYEKDNKDILNLKRSINENGSSSFSVNGVNVSVNQYLQILKEENILIKAKNFLVFQGDVEKVASQSPLDLTNMIENISGSINLKKQYETLRDEKEKCHDETSLKNSLRRNLKDDIKKLKLKCLESDQFVEKTEKLEKLMITKYLSKLDYNERIGVKLNRDLNEKNEVLDDISNSLEIKMNEYKDFVQTQSDEHMSIKNYETKIENDESNLKSLKVSLIPLESEALQLKEKSDDFEERIKRLELEKDEQLKVVQDNKNILNKLNDAFKLFQESNIEENDDEENDENKTSSFSSNIELLTEYNELRNKFLSIAGNLEFEVNDLNEDKFTLNNKIDSLSSNQLLINARVNDLKSQKSIYQTKINQLENQLKSKQSSIKNFRKELNSLDSLRSSIKEKESALNEELKAVLLRLNEINAVQRENKREKKLRETCSILKKLFPNVRGLLNDICKPKQKKYSVALAAILGKNFDSIIVDTLSTATECIEYMKEQRLGVASFIPLNTIKIQPLDSNLRNLSESAKPIIDVITYPSEFERVIQYVCGNSLVCDTIEIATSLRWGRNINVKLVTLDGALIHKSGLMTGGGIENFNTKWDKSELGSLNERKEELKLKIFEIHSKIPDDVKDRVLNDEINKLESQVPEINKNIDEIERKLRDVDTELEFENKVLNENDEAINNVKEEINEIDTKLESLNNELSVNQNKIYKSFCEKYSFKNIKEYEINYSSRVIKEANENSKFVKEIQRQENKLKFETERLDDYKLHIEKLVEDKNNYYESWQEVLQKVNELQSEIQSLQTELDQTKEKYKKLNEKAKKLLSKTTDMETIINNLKSEIKQTKKEINNIEEELESLKLKKKNLLVDAKMENVKIPLRSGSLDNLPLIDDNIEQDELSQEWDDLFNRLDINYSKLDDEYRVFIENEDGDEMDVDDNEEDHDDETSEKVEYSAKNIEEKCKLRIEQLSEELASIHPDIHAREHLEDAQEKFRQVESDFNEAKLAEKEIVEKFEKIRDERQDLFMKAFNHVSNNIDEVYKELTQSRSSPLGGSAYLTLEDEEEPFSYGIKYHIMPPLKRFRDMENLSGGEKTIGALALLFAIHSFHPSPFFVLDEVDAALDNANVDKIANYITKHRGPNFQFIVISLKNMLFERSDSLVGIYRDQDVNSSKILTLDLRGYAEAV
mgnify:CR=1 FL=1